MRLWKWEQMFTLMKEERLGGNQWELQGSNLATPNGTASSGKSDISRMND